MAQLANRLKNLYIAYGKSKKQNALVEKIASQLKEISDFNG
jgi:hypothetical protein